MLSVRKENGRAGSSLYCGVRPEKSMVRPSSLGHVPVFSLPSSKPSSVREADRPWEAASPILPPGALSKPMCMRPFRKVPVVRTTHLPSMRSPHAVSTPAARPSLHISRSAAACQSRTLGWFSITLFMANEYRALSAWTRVARTAGPFFMLSVRNWMPVSSVTRAITPSRASISLTRWPLPTPPTAGLHDIWATRSRLIVRRSVLAPIRPAASAASQPACPAPITITSYMNRFFLW